MTKKILLVVFFSASVFAIVYIVLVLSSTKGWSPLQTKPVYNVTPAPTINFISSLILSTKTKDTSVSLTVSPKKDPTALLAFSLRATLKSKQGGFPSIKQFAPETELVRSGWSFPIKKATKDANGDIKIELSGFFIGKNSFVVSDVINLASVTFSTTTLNSEGTVLTIDKEVTKFLSSDAISQIEISTQIDSEVQP